MQGEKPCDRHLEEQGLTVVRLQGLGAVRSRHGRRLETLGPPGAHHVLRVAEDRGSLAVPGDHHAADRGAYDRPALAQTVVDAVRVVDDAG